MTISMDKKYTLGGEPFTVLTVTKPGAYPVLGYALSGDVYSFDAQGDCRHITLSLVEVSPYADFVIDEPVMVRDYEQNKWERRHFAGVNIDGKASAWNNGATKWATELLPAKWNQCRRPTAEELAS